GCYRSSGSSRRTLPTRSGHSVHFGQLQTEVANPFEDSVERGLIAHPAAEVGLFRTTRRHLEPFERALEARPEAAPHHQLILRLTSVHRPQPRAIGNRRVTPKARA